MGNLSKQNHDAWRRGQTPYLERVFEGSLSKANRILNKIIGFHVHDLNMVASVNPRKETQYFKTGKGKNIHNDLKNLEIKKLEEAYSKHYYWNHSQEKKQDVIKRNITRIGIRLPTPEEPSHTTRHTDHVPRRFGWYE